MKYFKIDLNKLVVELLPPFLRKPVIVAFLIVLTSPLISIYLLFVALRRSTKYKLNHNGQVCYLRKVLNDRFDPQLRRIVIDDVERFLPVYIFTKSEDNPVYIYEDSGDAKPKYLYPDFQINDSSLADFLVKIPADVWNSQKTETESGLRFYRIEQVLNEYKLASKQFKIILKQ